MRIYLSIIIIASLLAACHWFQQPKQCLTKMSEREILDRIYKQHFNYVYASFKNEAGEALDSLDKLLLSQGKLAKDYYKDETGAIKEVRVRPMTLDDQFLEVQIRELSKNDIRQLKQVLVDCYKKEEYLIKIQEYSRTIPWNDWEKKEILDQQSLAIIYSIIEQCGFPCLENIDQEANKLLMNHLLNGSLKMLSYYYPKLKELAKQGKFPLSNLAFAEDRLLLRHGFKQWYGTQLFRLKKFGIEDIKHLDKRREVMGLEPMLTYLKKFDRKYTEQYLDLLEKTEILADNTKPSQ